MSRRTWITCEEIKNISKTYGPRKSAISRNIRKKNEKIFNGRTQQSIIVKAPQRPRNALTQVSQTPEDENHKECLTFVIYVVLRFKCRLLAHGPFVLISGKEWRDRPKAYATQGEVNLLMHTIFVLYCVEFDSQYWASNHLLESLLRLIDKIAEKQAFQVHNRMPSRETAITDSMAVYCAEAPSITCEKKI